jgi:hypothetical protein
MKRQKNSSQHDLGGKAFYAEKLRSKERIWAMKSNRAQASASLVPPASELVRRESRAWV